MLRDMNSLIFGFSIVTFTVTWWLAMIHIDKWRTIQINTLLNLINSKLQVPVNEWLHILSSVTGITLNSGTPTCVAQ